MWAGGLGVLGRLGSYSGLHSCVAWANLPLGAWTLLSGKWGDDTCLGVGVEVNLSRARPSVLAWEQGGVVAEAPLNLSVLICPVSCSGAGTREGLPISAQRRLEVGSTQCWAGRCGEDVKVLLPWEGWFRGSWLQNRPGNQESPGSGTETCCQVWPWHGLGGYVFLSSPHGPLPGSWVGMGVQVGGLCQGGTPGSQGTSPPLK